MKSKWIDWILLEYKDFVFLNILNEFVKMSCKLEEVGYI